MRFHGILDHSAFNPFALTSKMSTRLSINGIKSFHLNYIEAGFGLPSTAVMLLSVLQCKSKL